MKHSKVKVKVIQDIKENSNSREYLVGEILEVTIIKKESEYYQIVLEADIDMIPKSCAEVIGKER